jgi:hypothetical protein
MSTYSNLKFELITTGEQSGTWGATTDTNIGTAIEQAIVGKATLTSADFSSNVATLTLTNTNAAQNARALCLVISAGSTTATGTLNVPAIEKPYIIVNNTSYALTVKVSGLTGVSVPAGKRTVVYNDGTDVGDQVTYLSSLSLGSALPVASGGTGGTTAATGRTGLGATTVGGNLFTLSNPSAVTYLQVNADNTVSALDSTTFKSNLGITGGGSVSSVGGTGTVNGITLSGTVTSSGNLTLGGTLSNVSLTTQVTGTLPLTNGGTGGATQQAGLNSLAGATTSGYYLRGNGTNVSMSAIQAGDVPTLNQNTTGSAGSLSTTNWTVVESGGYLYFKYGGVNKMRLDSSGNLVVPGNVTAYGTI